MSSNGASGVKPSRPRIGLALSGGGFRASIFHLGVIRRLEELGIMQDVNVISTVSGGSIIGAYYVLEMERRLRARRKDFPQMPNAPASTAGGGEYPCSHISKIRVEVFKEIEKDFLKAVDKNLRARSMLPFSPFYHPIRFFRSIWPNYSRSDIIQREYDKFFFHDHPLDQLPSANDGKGPRDGMDGPRLVINATSLLTGERNGFSRIPASGVKEMKKPNTNVLGIARVVGASACVPGVFPPTPIFGDLFVDGGVSDNQGLDGLLEDGRWPAGATISDNDARDVLEQAEDYDAIIVSDASGQMEPIHGIKAKASAVLPRTFSIFQHEIRNKVIRRLQAWKDGQEWGPAGISASSLRRSAERPREFAYAQLYLNLKERWQPEAPGVAPKRVEARIRSEYIQAVGQIRTDLDQFSYIEREALIYHGYTTIDAQVQKWCPKLLENYKLEGGHPVPMSDPPPLFASRRSAEPVGPGHSDPVLTELRAGSQAVFLFRTWKKDKLALILIALFTLVLPMSAAVFALQTETVLNWLEKTFASPLRDWWTCSTPAMIYDFFQWLGGSVTFPVGIRGLLVLLAFTFALWVCLWITFLVTRRVAMRIDRQRYFRLTGVDPLGLEGSSNPASADTEGSPG